MNIIPEIAVILFAGIALAICVYVWIAYKEYAAVGYVIPCIYFIALYTAFAIYNPDDAMRRLWVRPGLVGIFMDIAIWRLVFIIRQRRKHSG